MTPRPVGPGRAEWMGAPVAQPQCPTCAAAEAWAARAQRQLDEERQRGAALAAAVRRHLAGGPVHELIDAVAEHDGRGA